MIEVRGLSKRFKSLQALDDVSFTARNGEITGLIGPNGAGKTTALRILATVMRPQSGCALVDGYDTLANRLEVQRRIGVLSDNRGLYPRLTAREHVLYFGRLHGIGKSELARRVDVLSRTLEMEDFIDRRAKGFSKGQTLKVALARALVHEPSNVLLDEPTNGLDIAASRAMRTLIRAMRDRGCCIVFSSHIMLEVAALSDRLVVIDRGRVVAQGTPDELRRQVGRDDLEDVFMALIGRGGEAPS